MLRLRTLVACICLVAAHPRQASPEQASPAAQIQGRVLRSETGVPLPGVKIQLLPPYVVGIANFPTAITDANGAYQFSGIKDGTYLISATAEGYVSAMYRHEGSDEVEVVRVDSGTPRENLDLRLTPEAVIRGSVVDSSHKPVAAGIPVAAVQKGTQEDGSLWLKPVASVPTDSEGHFALVGLLPGTYFVCVEGPGGWRLRPNPNERAGYKETWYGATHSIDGAIPLPLHEAQQVAGLQIAVEQEPRFHVIVRPSGPAGDASIDRYGVSLENRSHISIGKNDGTYLIPDVPAGHYTVVSTAWSRADYVGQGETDFNVVDGDVTVDVAVGGLAEITGVVTAEDGTLRPELHPMIRSTSPEGAAQGSEIAADGSFRLTRVLPGRYTFRLWSGAGDLKIRSARCGAGEINPATPLLVGAAQAVKDCSITVARH